MRYIKWIFFKTLIKYFCNSVWYSESLKVKKKTQKKEKKKPEIKNNEKNLIRLMFQIN